MEQTYPILDGFLFKRKLRCNMTFLALSIREYEALRRAGAYRAKLWCFPQDSQSFPIPSRGSSEFQTRVKPGSVIWGYQFIGNTGEDNGAGESEVQSFEVRDGCDDTALFSEPNTRQFDSRPQIQHLTKLMVVCPPGLINVVIASTYADPQNSQLILYGGEPVV